MRPNWPETGIRVDQYEYELTKMSTRWPNSEDDLTKWLRTDQIDENELTKMGTNWLKYELTLVRVDREPFWIPLLP